MESVAGLVEDLKSITHKLAVEDLAGLADADIETLLGDLHRAESMLRSAVVSTVGEIETRQLHLDDGHRTVATYMAHNLHMRRETAAATAQLAHKRWTLPHTTKAFQEGLISETHAQIIGRAFTPKVADVFARDTP